MRAPSIALLSLLLVTPACGDDTGGGGGATSSGGEGGSDIAPIGTGGGGGTPGPAGAELDAEACEHLAEGPVVETTAAATEDAAPDVSAAHTAHAITFVDFAGQNGGYVALQAAEAGELVLFLDADVPVAVRRAGGGDVPIEASCDPAACSGACSTIVGRHVVDVEVGTYVLELGPTTEPSVQLAHEAVGAHDDG